MIDQISISAGAVELMRRRNWTASTLARHLNQHPSSISLKLRGARRWTKQDITTLESLGLNSWARTPSPNEMVNHDYEFQIACSITYLVNHLSALVGANNLFSEYQKQAIRNLATSLEPLPEAFK